MSESNEKILPQDPEMDLKPLDESEIPEEILEVLEQMPEEEPKVEAPKESADAKAAREEARRKAEKRTNVLYMTIAVLFVVVAAVALIWRTNYIQSHATAVTIGDEKYTTGEVNFYFENVYRNFLTQASSMINSIGLNVNKPLRDQIIPDDVAEMMGGEGGKSWHDTFMEQALMQMTVVKAVNEKAEAEGYVYPDGLMTQFEESKAALAESAAANGMSVDDYLATTLDSTITEEIYNDHILRMMKYSAYAESFANSLTYSDEELEAVYAADPVTYELVSYEYVLIDGGVENKTDADGKTVTPTAEEREAALEAAKADAKEMLAALRAGEDLETLAAANEKAHYSYSDEASYYGDNVTKWLFDDARKPGDSAHLDNNGTNQYVVLFKDRYRDENPTIDVRHILFMAEPTLAKDDEGYEEEFQQLMAEARAQAEDVYAQWKAGEATEESFGALALEHSADGSKYSGGLYTEVPPGYMVTNFNDWCFDDARKPGDTGIVETEYGAHIMYFVGDNLTSWELAAASVLQAEDSNAWLEEMAATYTPKQHAFGMKFVD